MHIGACAYVLDKRHVKEEKRGGGHKMEEERRRRRNVVVTFLLEMPPFLSPSLLQFAPLSVRTYRSSSIVPPFSPQTFTFVICPGKKRRRRGIEPEEWAPKKRKKRTNEGEGRGRGSVRRRHSKICLSFTRAFQTKCDFLRGKRS